MKELLYTYRHKEPKKGFNCKDSLKQVKGFAVINSLEDVARMDLRFDKNEMFFLAKTIGLHLLFFEPENESTQIDISFESNDSRKKALQKVYNKNDYK